MKQDVPRDMVTSVKGRLLQMARIRGEELQNVLTRYAVERFLYRLSRSEHRPRFVLKGANVFTLWLGAAHRPTRDVDFLGYGSDEIEAVVLAFQEVCRLEVEADGLTFLAETVTGTSIREEERYAGVRVILRAMLGKAVIPLQIDVGFGDVITPAALEAELPTLLDSPKAYLWTYPRETVVAEKCEAMVDLGMANTRLKDFYDLWHLATHFDFEGPLLCEAIEATFGRRGTQIVASPVALTAGFSEDETKRKQWQGFWNKSGLPLQKSITLTECIGILRAFLLPPLGAIYNQNGFTSLWSHGHRSWRPPTEVNSGVEALAV